jgi:hypothetical protein
MRELAVNFMVQRSSRCLVNITLKAGHVIVFSMADFIF